MDNHNDASEINLTRAKESFYRALNLRRFQLINAVALIIGSIVLVESVSFIKMTLYTAYNQPETLAMYRYPTWFVISPKVIGFISATVYFIAAVFMILGTTIACLYFKKTLMDYLPPAEQDKLMEFIEKHPEHHKHFIDLN